MLPRLRLCRSTTSGDRSGHRAPGPIQGGNGAIRTEAPPWRKPVDYPNDQVSRRRSKSTLGVPLFQEQAMRLAWSPQDSPPGEADAASPCDGGVAAQTGVIEKFRSLHDRRACAGSGRRVRRAAVPPDRSGFGEHGFPESHAASFAPLVYVRRGSNVTIRWRSAALLNSEPMGFYAGAAASATRGARRGSARCRCAGHGADAAQDEPPTLGPTAVRLGLNRAPEVVAGRCRGTRRA